MKASDLFVAALEQEGVEYIFGVPGEENLDLLESLRCSEQIQFVTMRHEQAAGFLAATYGRLTGKAGVVLTTLGPGATNLVTAMAFAELGGMPLVAITGQKPVKSSKQGQFQILDVVDVMQPVSQFSSQVASGGRIPALVREAFRIAQGERSGATHLELAEDIAREETDAPLLPIPRSRLPAPAEGAIQEAAELLRAARAPLLVIGSAANRPHCVEPIRAFVSNHALPFVTTQLGKGVVDEHDDGFLGNAALSNDDYVHAAIKQADLILAIGHEVVEKPPFRMDHDEKRQVIHINVEPAEVDPLYFPQHEVVGDIAKAVSALDTALDTTPAGWDFKCFRSARDGLRKSIRQHEGDDSFPMRLPRIVCDLQNHLPKGSILTLDNGLYKIWFARNYLASEPLTVLLDNALASMGAGLPAAMAARFVHRDRPVLALCGDGGFLMNAQELETAVRLGLDLVILVFRDDAYGMIRWKQSAMGLPDFGLGYGNPDLVAFAECHGAHGHRVDSASGFAPTVSHALEAGGVHLIDVPVTYDGDDRYFAETIPDEVARHVNCD